MPLGDGNWREHLFGIVPALIIALPILCSAYGEYVYGRTKRMLAGLFLYLFAAMQWYVFVYGLLLILFTNEM